MGNSPINNRRENQGTAPLTRADAPKPAAPKPAQPPQAAATPMRRDTAKTRPLDPTLLSQAVDLEKLNIPEIKKPELKMESKGDAKPEEKKEDKGFFGNLWDDVKSVAQTTVKAVDTATDIIGAGVTETVQSLKEGQSILESLKDGVGVGAKKAFDEVVDPALDRSVLGENNEYADKAAGPLGDLLTNRLSIGESVSIKIEAGATIPTEIIGAPNVKLDGGGQLKIKRVEAQDAQGQPIIGPDGKPETRLEVELEASGRAGAAYSANVGFNATAQGLGHEVGLKAGAEAEAEAGLTGKLTMKLRFNPDSQQDMGNLAAMMNATAATGAAATIPGIGAVLALQAKDDIKRSLNSLPRHLDEVSGEGGLYAQANASAELGVGIFKAEGKDDETKDKDEPKGGALANFARGRFDAKKEEVHEGLLEKLKLDVGSLSAGLGVEGTVGAKKNFRTGETTVSFNVSGQVQVAGSVLGAGKGAAAEGQRKVGLVFDKQGGLKDVTVQQTLTKEQFLALQTTVEDVYGRPIDPGFIAKMTESDTVTVNYKVKPAILAQVRAAGTPAEMAKAAGSVAAAALSKDAYKLDPGDIITTHREELAFRLNLELSLGAEIGVRGGVVLAHEQETAVK